MNPNDRNVPLAGALVHGPAGESVNTPAGANVAEAQFNPRLDLDPDGGNDIAAPAEPGSSGRSTENAELLYNRAGQGVWRWPDGHREMAIIPGEDKRLYAQRPFRDRGVQIASTDENLLD